MSRNVVYNVYLNTSMVCVVTRSTLFINFAPLYLILISLLVILLPYSRFHSPYTFHFIVFLVLFVLNNHILHCSPLNPITPTTFTPTCLTVCPSLPCFTSCSVSFFPVVLLYVPPDPIIFRSNYSTLFNSSIYLFSFHSFPCAVPIPLSLHFSLYFSFFILRKPWSLDLNFYLISLYSTLTRSYTLVYSIALLLRSVWTYPAPFYLLTALHYPSFIYTLLLRPCSISSCLTSTSIHLLA